MLQAYRAISRVVFPTYTRLNINMMPIIMGDKNSIPDFAKQYLPMIDQCNLEEGSTVYLTVSESLVEAGKTQRRPGVHTDGTNIYGWGSGWGMGRPCSHSSMQEDGIYLASTDGACQVWNTQVYDSDELGGCDYPDKNVETKVMEPNTLYWMTDRTPHESLENETTSKRQFFRLVSEKVGIWSKADSTENPLGVKPKTKIIEESKFNLFG